MQSTSEPISAYVHIPFCHHHCGYCNFTLIAGRNELIDAYLDALIKDLHSLRSPRKVQTIFIGGGTPSLLDEQQMIRLVEALGQWFDVGEVREFSIEVNPNDVTREKANLWRSLGITRVSVGGQSFDAPKLKVLEREHSPEQLRESLWLLKECLPKVSLDLIFGAPNETLDVWQADLDDALRLNLSHISTYGLTFEKGSRFWGMRHKGMLESVDEEVELLMYQTARRRLMERGYEHYEVSNFAASGEQCLHNETYWNGMHYWAFGAGAAYYVESRRGVKHRSTTTYIKKLLRDESPVAEEETLSQEQVIRERFVFGMRKLCGVPLESLELERYPDLQDALLTQVDRHIAEGWMQHKEGRVALTEKGLWVSDSLWGCYL
jgi:oxygen-independent coproporphyrinogen-3 oxidase